MQDPSLFYDPADSKEMDTQANTNQMESPDDDGILAEQKAGENDSMEGRSSSKAPSESSKPETSHTDITTYTDTSVAFNSDESMAAMDTLKEGKDGSPANTTGDALTADFDSIARDAALLLDKKLEDNREWVQKILHEMTAYAKTISEVNSEYTRIQSLEHEESQRLDQVEPDVQGATSHLLENPFFGGMVNHLNAGNGVALGSKRKPDQQA
jgi:hypothetical protein